MKTIFTNVVKNQNILYVNWWSKYSTDNAVSACFIQQEWMITLEMYLDMKVIKSVPIFWAWMISFYLLKRKQDTGTAWLTVSGKEIKFEWLMDTTSRYKIIFLVRIPKIIITNRVIFYNICIHINFVNHNFILYIHKVKFTE